MTLYQFLPYPENKPPANDFYNCICRGPNGDPEKGLIHYHSDTGWKNGFYNDVVTHFLAPLPEPSTNAWPQFLKDVDHALQMAHAKNAGIYIAAAARELLKSVSIPADPDDEKAAEGWAISNGYEHEQEISKQAFLAGCAHKAAQQQHHFTDTEGRKGGGC